MKKLFSKNNKNGYTIIETMIAISLFIIIVMAGMDTLLNAGLVHQKSQGLRSVIDSLSFTMEDMSRNLRTGVNYYCVTGGGQIPFDTNQTNSCPNSNGSAVSFKASDGNQWAYYFITNPDPNNSGFYSISKRTVANGMPTDIQLTPNEVLIDPKSSFTVLGAEPPSSTAPPGDQQQPFITIRLMGKIRYKNTDTPFSLQTSVSQRQVDIGT